MKKKYNFIILRSVLIAIFVAGLSSCIKDDPERCVDPRGNVRLTLSLDINVSSRSSNLDRYQINSVRVFVFDAVTNKYVSDNTGGPYTPGTEYEMYFSIPAGNYHFIVWTNQDDIIYKINKDATVSNMNDLELYLDSGSGNLISDIPDLLYGKSESEDPVANNGVKIEKYKNNHVQVVVKPDTYKINLKVTGLPVTTDIYQFGISDNNSHYGFAANNLVEGMTTFQHVRTCTQSGGQLNTSIKVLRLTDNRSPILSFKKDAHILYQDNLIETIKRAYLISGDPVDFGEIYTYDIEFSYDTNMEMTVSVNGWEYKHITGNLE